MHYYIILMNTLLCMHVCMRGHPSTHASNTSVSTHIMCNETDYFTIIIIVLLFYCNVMYLCMERKIRIRILYYYCNKEKRKI